MEKKDGKESPEKKDDKKDDDKSKSAKQTVKLKLFIWGKESYW